MVRNGYPLAVIPYKKLGAPGFARASNYQLPHGFFIVFYSVFYKVLKMPAEAVIVPEERWQCVFHFYLEARRQKYRAYHIGNHFVQIKDAAFRFQLINSRIVKDALNKHIHFLYAGKDI